MDNDFRAGFFIGIMTMVVAILIAALLAACGPDFGTFAQVAVETPTPIVQPAEIDEPGHEVLMREYTTWHGASTDTVCMVTMRSNCAAWEAWKTPPPSPRWPVHDQRTPAPTVPPECIV